MRLGFDHKKRTGGAEREARLLLAHPNRGEFVLEVEISALIENQEVLALAVMRTADQRNVALAGRDPRQRDPRDIGARDLLAPEGARGYPDAVDHDGMPSPDI